MGAFSNKELGLKWGSTYQVRRLLDPLPPTHRVNQPLLIHDLDMGIACSLANFLCPRAIRRNNQVSDFA